MISRHVMKRQDSVTILSQRERDPHKSLITNKNEKKRPVLQEMVLGERLQAFLLNEIQQLQ